MKYKALYSPKQFFSFKGSVYRATDGEFITNDKELVNFLDGHFAWTCLTPKEEPKKEIPKKEPVKVKVKKGAK